MDNRELLRLFQDHLVEAPEGAKDLSVNLIQEEMEEMLIRASTLNERELVHYPDIIELIPELPNGSRILAIDYRTIPGNTTKVVPMEQEFKAAEENGEISLEKTPTLIVHSSGNASIWFAKIARQKGYTVEVVIMDYASVPRLNTLCASGANINFVRGELGVDAMIKRAKQLEQSIKGSKFLDQTHSPDNYKGFIPHGRRAVRKLLLQGLVPTHLVAGVGTGGTYTGLSEGVNELAPECECIAVEVREKPYLTDEYPDTELKIDPDSFIAKKTSDDNFWLESYPEASQIPGLAANIHGINMVKQFEEDRNPQTITVKNETGIKAARLLAREYQQFAGPSTGTTFAAALTIAEQNPNSVVLMPICDLGTQYSGEIWHKDKRHIAEFKATKEVIGSTIEVKDRVHQDMTTDHLHVKEMGGPLSTASLLLLSEIACRDLEWKLGLIDKEFDSLGCGTDNEFTHFRYIPAGTPLSIKSKIISFEPKGEKKILKFLVEIFAENKDGEYVKICTPLIHKRTILRLNEFRESKLGENGKFGDSKL
jgi:cysteine synthase A